MTERCTLGEMMIDQLARTINDGTLVFHGFGSPLVQLALHVAKQIYAPDIVLVAGATYGVNPSPPFLTPTTNDWVLDRGAECHLDISELFDLAARGRMGKMFLSGLQIDRWGNTNVTRLGGERLKLKLPGGGGACNLSCDANDITLWTAAHRCEPGKDGQRRYRLVTQCDFVTGLGHRSADGRRREELGYRNGGPQWLVTDLGLFDFDADGHMKLCALYPHTTLQDVLDNTEFRPVISDRLYTLPTPSLEVLNVIRQLDPLKIHEKEMRPKDRAAQITLDRRAAS